MKTLYLECNMGAAGDMLTAALYELLDRQQKEDFLRTMNGLLPGVTVTAVPAVTCGIAGTRMEVTVHGQEEVSHDLPLGTAASEVHEHPHDHEHPHEHDHHHDHDHPHDHEHSHEHGHHHHAAPADIDRILDHLPVPEAVRENAKAVYRRIADAEAAAHGVPVTEIHFHEVGALDAVADVTGVCLALHLLGAERITASPVHVGSGQVRCAHGVMPVPAPATAHLLRGVLCYGGEIRGELCTPTGAALLAHFAAFFGPQPLMTLEATGVGVGRKEFPAANCVRALLGESGQAGREEITELVCHIDDSTAEALAYACETLMAQGALDVTTAPIVMKKGRAAAALTVLCRPADEERLSRAVLRETSTLGVRARRCARYVLTPSCRTVETAFGPIAIKRGEGFGICKEKPEYGDAAAAARRCGVPFQTVWEAAVKAAAEQEAPRG